MIGSYQQTCLYLLIGLVGLTFLCSDDDPLTSYDDPCCDFAI